MPNVVFVAPYLLPTTSRFVEAAATIPDVRLGLVTHDPADQLAPGLRGRLAGHWRAGNALDPEQLGEAVKAMGAHLGSVEVLLGALEELQVPMAMVRQGLGIPGMSVDTALNFRDKDRMKSLLASKGLPCAQHRLVGDEGEARSFIGEIGLPVVAKPPAGSGTRNTFRLDTTEQVEEWLRWSPPTGEAPTLLEEFITGEEHAFDCVFLRGRPVFWNISRYYPTPLEVMANPWIQWAVVLPRDITGPEYQEIREVGPAAISALGMETGLVHMEWFRRVDGSIAVSEAAARPPGAQFSSLISLAHDYDLYAGWARLMILGQFHPPQRKYSVGAAYLRGQGNGKITAIHGLEAAQQEVAGMVMEVKLPEPGQPPSGHYEGDGYVIVRHEETAAVERALAAIIDKVRVELS